MRTDQPMQTHFTTVSREQSERFALKACLTSFVYGTLKSGQSNHDYFCGNAAHIQPATTIGRLYALPAGYPALVVPESHILAHGTADPLADAATQTRIADGFVKQPDLSRPGSDWDLVHGEIITFTEPRRSLPPIDRLEGFHPGGRSLYERVLLPVLVDGDHRLAWTYIMPQCSAGQRLKSGIWLPRNN